MVVSEIHINVFSCAWASWDATIRKTCRRITRATSETLEGGVGVRDVAEHVIERPVLQHENNYVLRVVHGVSGQ